MRRIELTGARNVRDVGGAAGSGGRRVGYGRLLRSDSPASYSEADVTKMVDEHHVSAVIDLRLASQAIDGSGPIAHRVPRQLIDVVGLAGLHNVDRSTMTPTGWMTIMFDRFAPAFAAVARVIVDNHDGATLIHCQGGKDRTGLIAALCLRVAGVSRADVIDDFMLSAEAHEAFKAHFVDLGQYEQMPEFARSNVRVEAVEAMLDRQEAEWPDLDAYLVAGGGSADLGERLREHLLSD